MCNFLQEVKQRSPAYWLPRGFAQLLSYMLQNCFLRDDIICSEVAPAISNTNHRSAFLDLSTGQTEDGLYPAEVPLYQMTRTYVKGYGN